MVLCTTSEVDWTYVGVASTVASVEVDSLVAKTWLEGESLVAAAEVEGT